MAVPTPHESTLASPGGGRARMLDELERHLVEMFGEGECARRFFAPGRVNLMGAHLDYNGGPVMPMPVDRGTLVLARPNSVGRVRLTSLRESGHFDGARLPARSTGCWYDYPIGVVRQLLPGTIAPADADVDADVDAADDAELDVDGRGATAATPVGPNGIDLAFGGDLPIGAGLSSSASICIATALAAGATLSGGTGASNESHARGAESPRAARWVEQALVAEREFVGVRCGIMDPFAVGFGRPGHLLWLECRTRRFEHVPLDPQRYLVAVVDSGVRRELAAGEFNVRVAQCGAVLDGLRVATPDLAWLCDAPRAAFERIASRLDAAVAARGRHVFDELERTLAARDALERGDVAAFGRAMTESHASLRSNYEVSTPELDVLVRAATSVDGVLGSRLTGAGFGGCTVVLLERHARAALVEAVTRGYREACGREAAIEFFAGGDGPHEIAS